MNLKITGTDKADSRFLGFEKVLERIGEVAVQAGSARHYAHPQDVSCVSAEVLPFISQS